jgi:hypothetical protein
MLTIRSIFAAAAVTFALAAPAFAQNISLELSDRLGVQGIMPDTASPGSRLNVRPSGHALVMKHAVPGQTGTIVYWSYGPVYATRDGREQQVRAF